MKLLKVGSDASCDIILHSNKVSALHAEITLLDNGDILLEDKNSRYGTFIMNMPLKTATSVSVKRGDAIRFADVELLWNQIPMPDDNSMYKAVYGIGSSFRNEIQISGNTVSRFHATLKIDKRGRAYIQDHSKNGTTINGTRIGAGRDIPVKRSDSVVCGGVPVNLSQYIHVSLWPKLLKIAACVVVLAGCVWGISRIIPNLSTNNDPEKYIPTCVYVHAYYHYTANVVDDPFVEICRKYDIKYNSTYEFGKNNAGELGLIDGSGGYNSIGYCGTAFFVTNDGKMITNRHISSPWLFVDDSEKASIQLQINTYKEALLPVNQLRTQNDLERVYEAAQDESLLSGIIYILWQNDYMTLDQLNGVINLYKQCKVDITGELDYIAVGYANRKYSNTDEFDRCSVIAEHDDMNVDLALLQLNNPVTPVSVKKIVDLSKAVVNAQNISPLKETYYYIGYPLGTALNLNNKEQGLTPLLNEVKISRKTGKYTASLQGEIVSGASGSPILNNKGQLVGVVTSSVAHTLMSECVLARYAKELLNKTEENR